MIGNMAESSREAEGASSASATASAPSLLDEIGEALAQSMLVFLMADLRLLSGTGRCITKYETIAIDSDCMARDTSAKMAGLIEEDEEDEEEVGKDAVDFGLSPAHLMAVLILELHNSVDKRRKKLSMDADGHGSATEESDNKDDVGNDMTQVLEADEENVRRGKRPLEVPFGAKIKNSNHDGRHALLRAYADMIGGDLNAEIPHIEARKSMLKFAASSNALLHSINEDEEVGGGEDDAGEDGAQGDEELGQRMLNDPMGLAQSRLRAAAAKNPVSLRNLQAANPITQSKLQRAKNAATNQSIFMRDSEREHQHLGEVVDAVFEMGEQSPSVRSMLGSKLKPGDSLTQEMMIKIMKKAVESRDGDRLQFMQHFFKKDSVSQLMVRSKAKIYWMNDWYPLKDLTYAIAVNEEKKRVLVVFRGAITRADWSHAADWKQVYVNNPVKENYEGKHEKIGLSRGFLMYLFRRRQDTGTLKVDEILNMAHKYGKEKIGEDYKLVVAGHSLGAALSTLFGFFASTDERFTRNGPVKIFTFGSPYVAGHSFADTFRHQEQCKKLQYARVYNHNDFVAHLPTNFGVTRRGSTFRHVGIGIKVPGLPSNLCGCFFKRKWKPSIFYIGDEGFTRSYLRGIGRNFLLHMPLPWQIAKMHTLEELQKRLIFGEMLDDTACNFELLKKPIGELYEMFMANISTTK